MPEAAWYPDPTDPAQTRWWDGTAWTEHARPIERAPAYQPMQQPVLPRPPVAAEPGPAIRPGGPFTVAALLFAIVPAAGVFFTGADLGASLFGQIVFGVVASIVSVPLAFWDRHSLDTHGYTRSAMAEPWFALLPIFYLVSRLMKVGTGTLVFLVLWVAASVLTYVVGPEL